MSQISGKLITHNYTGFRGVDFTNKEVALFRSPDSLNMWKNYRTQGRCIETRPDIEKLDDYPYSVFGLFFYKVGNREMLIVHSGVYLYKEENGVRTQLRSGMNPKKSKFFIYDNVLYILDGISYLQYDGTTCKEVEGYIPTTTIAMTPAGKGTAFQNVNLINPIRRNTFVGDGESTVYVLDSAGAIDTNYPVRVNINDHSVTAGFTVDYTNGTVTFTTAPSEPDTVGEPNVMIEFSKTISGYKDRLTKCTLVTEFDNRIFFSGNPDYPTMLFHSELYDPTYIDDQNYYTDGFDDAKIKSIVTGNNAIWVFKEPSQSNNGVFYHTPSVYADQKAYTSTNSSISIGCVSEAINFNDDIVFFSERGLEGITSDITTEQMVTHRSNLVDAKLLRENNYKSPLLAEWEGYLLVFIDNHVYLADSNAGYADFARYEWFYWELPITPTSVLVKDNVLYMGTENALYSLTDFADTREVNSYWTTSYDEFGYPQYQKTTNKRGSVLDCEGDEISLYTNIDEKGFTFVKTYTDKELYAVNRIKKKKWKGIQLKISTTKNVKIYSCTLESYVGGYIKR